MANLLRRLRTGAKSHTTAPPLIVCDLALHFSALSTYNIFIVDIYFWRALGAAPA
jgi:hypothetical protein